MTIPLAPLHPNLFRLPLKHAHTHTHTSHTYVNVSHHFKRTHRTIFLLSRFPTTPSSSISPSFAHPRSTYHFLSSSRLLLPSSQRTYTHAPSSPPLFPVFSADVLPVYPGLSTIRPIKAPSNWTVYVIHIKTESSFCCFLMSLQDETSYYVLASGYGGSR